MRSWGADGAVDVEEHKDLGCRAGCASLESSGTAGSLV